MPFIRERCCSGDVSDDTLWVDSAKVIWWPRWFSGLRLASRMVVLQRIPRIIRFVADRITGGERGREGRLTDRIGLGVLTRLVHRDLVDEVLADTGRTERRRRLLPARVVVYFVLAMRSLSSPSTEPMALFLGAREDDRDRVQVISGQTADPMFGGAI